MRRRQLRIKRRKRMDQQIILAVQGEVVPEIFVQIIVITMIKITTIMMMMMKNWNMMTR